MGLPHEYGKVEKTRDEKRATLGKSSRKKKQDPILAATMTFDG